VPRPKTASASREDSSSPELGLGQLPWQQLPMNLSGTESRGTPNTPNHGWKAPSEQTMKAHNSSQSQGFIYRGTRPRLA
jgi:hypothetical protein